MSGAPVPAVGVICFRGDEVLLIRRGQPPRLGEWSLPGGRIEFGEAVAGLVAVVDGLFGEKHYVLIDYAARWVSGEPVAGDDAADARFMPLPEALAAVDWEETRRVIVEAHQLLTAKTG